MQVDGLLLRISACIYIPHGVHLYNNSHNNRTCSKEAAEFETTTIMEYPVPRNNDIVLLDWRNALWYIYRSQTYTYVTCSYQN